MNHDPLLISFFLFLAALVLFAFWLAENLLTGALSRLFANVERYPDLKAEGDFQRLENQLSQIETVIAMSRQSYNLTVQAYNNAVDTLPTNLVASFSGFADRPYLTAEESDRS